MHICVTYWGGGGAEEERKLYCEDLDSFTARAFLLPSCICWIFFFFLSLSYTNWLDKTTPSRFAEGIGLSQRYPQLSEHLPREQGQGRRCIEKAEGGGVCFFRDLGIFLSAISRHWTLSCKDRGANSFSTEALPSVHTREVYPAAFASRALSAQTSLPRASPASGPSLTAVTSGPRKEIGDSQSSASSSCLCTRPLSSPRAGPEVLTAAEPHGSSVRAPVVAWQGAQPPGPVCSRGAEGASRLLLQPGAPLACLPNPFTPASAEVP